MNVIHISRDRFESIKKQGYQMDISEERLAQMPDGDTEYHILDGEFAWCETCGASAQSVAAWTPAELSTIKNSGQPRTGAANA